MSATAADLAAGAPSTALAPRRGEPGRSAGDRAARLARSRSALILGAFLTSRLLVLGGGLAGSLSSGRRSGWSSFDPAGITGHLGPVGDALAGVAVRWDSLHYLAVARHGYATVGNAVFFPLYPLLLRAFALILGSDVIAGVAISCVSFVVALELLHRLTELELGRGAADAAVLLLCFAPLSFFFSAVYTESLFLALSIGAVYAARRERWALACGLGALAALTRVPGVLLAVPIAVLFWRTNRGAVDRRLAWLLLIPAAVSAYAIYLASRGFGVLAPVAQQGAAQHGHRFTGPVSTIAAALQSAASGLGAIVRGTDPVLSPTIGGPLSASAESVVLLGVLCLAGWALVACSRRLPSAYSLYAAVALVVCLSSPVSRQPLISLDRYALTIFPLWMAAGALLSRRRRLWPVLVLMGALLAFYSFEFATWAFVA